MNQFEKDKRSIEAAIRSGKRARLEIELNPEMVEWLLTMNSERQRKLAVARVNELVCKIRRYGWVECEDMKFADHGLVNGQHRLVALSSIYKKGEMVRPTPTTGLIVNISVLEQKLIDTGQSRNMNQRLFMTTGQKFPRNQVAAVNFELSYPNVQHSRSKIFEEDILKALQDHVWSAFFEEFPTGTKLPNYIKEQSIQTPIYVAIKQMWERCPPNVWEKFLHEFQGPGASRPIQKLRELIAIGYKSFKDYGGPSRAMLYRYAVTYLNAFMHGRNTTPKKITGEWE